MREASRKPISVLAVVAVLGLVWLPAEHVHEAHDGDDHAGGGHADVVHRHFTPHHGHEPGAALDHEEAAARYLQSPFTIEQAATVGSSGDVALTHPVEPEPPTEFSRTTPSLFERVHDPPWLSLAGLRAPPALLV